MTLGEMDGYVTTLVVWPDTNFCQSGPVTDLWYRKIGWDFRPQCLFLMS